MSNGNKVSQYPAHQWSFSHKTNMSMSEKKLNARNNYPFSGLASQREGFQVSTILLHIVGMNFDEGFMLIIYPVAEDL